MIIITLTYYIEFGFDIRDAKRYIERNHVVKEC